MKKCALVMEDHGYVRPYCDGGPEPPSGHPLVLLVHGYNNDAVQAELSFYAMRRNLDNLLSLNGTGEALRREFQSRLWEFYWPGHLRLRRFGSRRAAFEVVPSALSYSHEVVKARTWVAQSLADYLRLRTPSEVFFIAHSLGCRVALEAVKRLSASPAPDLRVAGFLLMAGAVPVNLLDPDGDLFPSAIEVRRRYSLHSWRDLVLGVAFPPGQILAGEAPVYGLPVATGLLGGPRTMWVRHADTRLSHGGYWRQGLFRGGTAGVSELAAAIFGVAVDHGISLSELPRVTADSALSILPESQIASGRLPGSNWLEEDYVRADLAAAVRRL
jgi:hypothetical protein